MSFPILPIRRLQTNGGAIAVRIGCLFPINTSHRVSGARLGLGESITMVERGMRGIPARVRTDSAKVRLGRAPEGRGTAFASPKDTWR